MIDVVFFFDPECPWTWRASRWLVDVSQARGLTVDWRPLSLAVLNQSNEGDVPEEHRVAIEASHRALRLVEALRQAGRHDDAARFYTELGTRVHERGETLTVEPVRAAAVRASTEAAVAAAGPGVGSPVLLLPDVERGVQGPVLAEVPAEKDALALWDAVETLIR